jgi:putative sterol carrier protein
VANEIFSSAWAEAWGEELNRSDRYRQSASGWEGAIAFVLGTDPASGFTESRRVWLDLHHGACRQARTATEEDLAQAPFVLSAPAGVWRRVLAGDLEPVLALMSGKLKLEKGSLAKILPFTLAAKEMVAAAGRVESLPWPEDLSEE